MAVRVSVGFTSDMTDLPELIHCGQMVLRRTRVADAGRIAAAVAESLDHLRPYLPWATEEAGTVEAQRARLAVDEQSWPEGSAYTYLLVGTEPDPVTGPVLGLVGVHRRIGPGGLEICYWVHAKHARRGLISAAVKAVTDAALALPEVSRVEIHCDVTNVASAGVPRKLGYRLARVEQQERLAPADTGRQQIWIYP